MKLMVRNFLLIISGMTIITALLVLLFSTSAASEIRIVPTLSGEKVFKQKLLYYSIANTIDVAML